MAAATTSNPSHIVEVGEEGPSYPYPSHLCGTAGAGAGGFASVKLSGRDKYNAWEAQMRCLFVSHGMIGFIGDESTNPDQNQGKGKGNKAAGDRNEAWIRSDALVKSWIIGSLSEEVAVFIINRLKNLDFTAKKLWDELQTIYGPHVHVTPQPTPEAEGNLIATEHGNSLEDESKDKEMREEEGEQAKYRRYLYREILGDYWGREYKSLKEEVMRITYKITSNGNTILHVAVSTGRKQRLLELLLDLELTSKKDHTQLNELKNSDGSTPLHVAAIVGNSEAATMLVKRDRGLLFAKDNEGHTPLAIALFNMHTHTSNCLLDQMTQYERKIIFSGTSGDELLVTIISSKDFRLATAYLDSYYTTLHSDAALMAIAQNFPCQPSKWVGDFEMFLNGALEDIKYILRNLMGCKYTLMEPILLAMLAGLMVIVYIFPYLLFLLVRIFYVKKLGIHQDAIELVEKICSKIKYSSIDPRAPHNFYMNTIVEATRQNAVEVVEVIVKVFPNAIWSVNEDGHNIIQYAVINRSEKVYNLLYHMSEHKNIYRTIKDSSGNNLLHLAAKLAPADKLNLISGAALQIQRELQWYKEVEGFVCPLNSIQKNTFGETPQMVFTREHRDLVMEGEKWMKSAAESYTITAALIATIAFAAAITVPGGNQQETGVPIFTNNAAFTIFAISDAISLFTSVTSLLVFLSILTTRFAEQDFLFKLPTKLILGLVTLFLSTTTMIVAFGATLYLMFGQRNSHILIPIGVLTCLPITSFVTLQFPLVADLMSATYVRGIFGKKGNVILYTRGGRIRRRGIAEFFY